MSDQMTTMKMHVAPNAGVQLTEPVPAFTDANSRKVEANLCCPSALGCCLSMCVPCIWFCSCRVINPNEEAVVLNFGKYVGIVNKPDWYCVNPCGVTLNVVSTKTQSFQVEKVKTADQNGNPIVVDAIVTYKVDNSERALLRVDNYKQLLQTTSSAVLRTVVAMFPYESHSNGPSLKSDHATVAHQLVTRLQERMTEAGVRIVGFEINDLSYAPEIASAMLMRQQAEAMVAARRKIVEGAVEIATEALNSLQQRGFQFTESDRVKTASNLITVICSESKVQNTMSVNTI
eukprot:GILJ01000519.1.p1 GENE.GILJ01000519.1~~GILJ01000519.1.p1  ORF type:complete len:303 (+),score=30.46 GILJ01000519.1:44-910(+)